MEKILQIVNRYPLSTLCVVVVWVLSLTPIFPETPLDDVAFIDKWTHLVMYGGLSLVIWWEYLRSHQGGMDYEKVFFWAVCAPVLMGAVLELAQEYCTGSHRNGDWLDFVADTCGVVVGAILGMMLHQFYYHHAHHAS